MCCFFKVILVLMYRTFNINTNYLANKLTYKNYIKAEIPFFYKFSDIVIMFFNYLPVNLYLCTNIY